MLKKNYLQNKADGANKLDLIRVIGFIPRQKEVFKKSLSFSSSLILKRRI